MKATVFSIEEFATFDGPGIRMTVFIKGCPLSCVWCHNPEGQSRSPELMRSPNGCVGCGACERLAKREGDRLILTEESARACPRSLVKTCGKEYEAQEIVDKVLKNARVLNMNGGGVTFSGGEPLYSHEFLIECLTLLEGKVNRAIQTTGFTSPERFEEALKKCDYVLCDLKIMDEQDHKRYCGVSNRLIKQNYRALVKSGVEFITRVPLIPGVTDTERNLTEIARFMAENGVKKVEVLPYNRMAGAKYGRLLRSYDVEFDEERAVFTGAEIFEKFGISHKVM